MKNLITYLLVIDFLLNGLCLIAQPIQNGPFDPSDIAREYIYAHLREWGLTPGDVAEMTMNDLYTDQKTGITRVYFLQRYQGIPVSKAILNINIDKTGKIFFAGNRFEKDIKAKINTHVPSLRAADAVTQLATHLGITTEEPRSKTSAKESQYLFDKGHMASEDITATLSYQPYDGNLRLAWDILFAPKNKNDKWSTRIDAITGKVLNEDNWTKYCSPMDVSLQEDDHSCDEHIPSMNSTSPALTDEPLYNVWPAPAASPSHGPRTITNGTKDTLASPFGWHDTDGQPGHEYTITQGNNAHAFQDHDGDFLSSDDEPDGGPEMIFDFPFDPAWEPEEYVDASVVNAFYWVNFMHDFSYRFGFDEVAGNYQQNNYDRGGLSNDPVVVRVQQGMDVGKENNAFFTYSTDGLPGRMAVYVFRDTKNFIQVNEPASVEGRYKTSFPSEGWGAGTYVTDIPLTGEVVIVNDGIESPYSSDACEEIINVNELAGKIALIDRGGCEFGWKALQAQNAGAIGVLFANLDDDNYTMNPGTYGASVQIPVLMIGRSDCQSIRAFVGQGLKVTFVDPGENSPVALDGDLDNMLIAHEYGHGIADRIIGGPSVDCLDNAEQMGEGWCDFFALALTVKPGDTGEKKRGFATYSIRDNLNGKGYRRYPYSTDMNLMPLTYKDIATNFDSHNLGEVWAAALWDMYWALVDQYGWSENLYDESSGNYRAIKLVMDALKNTPCSPGFIDGRDAILAADSSLYNGEDACLIWEIFARRGIGYSADQGSPFDAGDQTEAFDLPPICTGKIIVIKSVTDFIQPGEPIQVMITVGNYKTDTVTNVVVSDIIPSGTTYKNNSSNLPADIHGNSISFHLGDMEFQEEINITYTLETDPSGWSKRIFLDEVSGENNTHWLTYTMGNIASNEWTATNSYPAHTGSFTWNSQEIKEKCRQVLELNPEEFVYHVQDDRPTLRFFHRYITKASISGGIVEVKEVNSENWSQVGDYMLRNGYFGPIDYLTFISPDLKGFSGYSGTSFKDTYVDLSPWSGKDILVRFRFGTHSNSNNGLGWFIDDIEFMNLFAYNTEVCVMSDQGDFECATAPEAGTIVDSREDPLSSNDVIQELPLNIYPNPATDMIHITWPGENPLTGNIILRTIDGKEVITETFNARDTNSLSLRTERIPPGMYILDACTTSGRFVGKVIIQK